MSRDLSNQFQKEINVADPCDVVVYALEFNSPNLATPVRINNAGEDIVSQGDTYIFCPFNISIPDDRDGQLPQANVEISNVGRDIIRWIEQTQGGEDVEIIIKVFLKSTPDVIEIQLCCSMDNISISPYTISARIGYEDILNKPAVGWAFTRRTTPGLF